MKIPLLRFKDLPAKYEPRKSQSYCKKSAKLQSRDIELFVSIGKE